MVTEFKAYKTSDGAVLHTESEGLHHELALIVLEGLKDNQSNAGMAQANAVVEQLKKRDADVTNLLRRHREINPRAALAVHGIKQVS